MYLHDLTGYLYGESQAIDLTWVGYTYTGGLTQTQISSDKRFPNLKVEQYMCNDKLTLKFGPLKRYYNSFDLYLSGHLNAYLGLNKAEYEVQVRKE